MNSRILLIIISLLLSVAFLQSTAQQTGTPIAGKVSADHSVLATGEWWRISVDESGVYRITYQDLQTWGFQNSIESAAVRIFGNGGRMLPELTNDPRYDDLIQIPLWIEDHGDGMIDQADDYILFYAEGPLSWRYDSIQDRYLHEQNYYCDRISYFLNFSAETGRRIYTKNPLTVAPDNFLYSFNDHRCHELDSVNLIHSGKIWYGESFNMDTIRTFSFSFPETTVGSMIDTRISVVARSLDSSWFKFYLNDTVLNMMILPVDPNQNTDYVKMGLANFSTAADGLTAELILDYEKPSEADNAWLNFIEITGEQDLKFNSGQFAFRNKEMKGTGISRFVMEGLAATARVWNVTEPQYAYEMQLFDDAPDRYFQSSGDSLSEFVVFDTTAFFSPRLEEKLANQDLHGTGFPDFIIITHPDFKSEAERLADFRRQQDGLDVIVIEPQLIYNEFSSGNQDPTAIRDFLRMLYLRAGSDSMKFPHFLLLFGDGSYDMKNRVQQNTNFIPTYQTNNSHTPVSSYVSDDYFGILDDGEGPNAIGTLDVGIGRLPVTTLAEAKTVVDKIMRYSSKTDLLPPGTQSSASQVSNFGNWRNTMIFIADDEDGNLHLRQAETLIRTLDSIGVSCNYDKQYLDAYVQEHTILGPRYPDVHEAIKQRMAAGALIFNYTGHGGEGGLTEEGIIDISDIDAWTNYLNMPVVITATCEFSRYDNPAHRSAGEHVLLNPNGGGIALFSTTRVAYAHSNMVINMNLLDQTFSEGSSYRLGDLIRRAKVASGAGVYIQNFTLLGDPSMKLAIPEYKVFLSSVNGDSLGSIDTVYAGQIINVSGYIGDETASLLSDFEGQLDITLYDKPSKVSTLGNDPLSYIEVFESTRDVLFRGLATVTHGIFSFKLTVPKDVSFRDGNARFSLYARSMNHDAVGVNTDLCLMNDGNAGNGDGHGPEIGLFFNDRGFLPDGVTRPDTRFIADLKDEDGINFFSTGIGHDIMMVLDGDFVNPIVMNDYYQPMPDHSDQGSIYYDISGLIEGPHTLWLKAWDVLNFPSEKEIQFYVLSDHPISLNHVNVYPNPMSDIVQCCFDRNETSMDQLVQVNISGVDGRSICWWEEKLNPNSGISVCVHWDGNDQMGHETPSGVYVLNIKLIDGDGHIRQFYGKISKVE